MKTYHAIKTLALGGILVLFPVADYEPLDTYSEITQGGQTEMVQQPY